MKVGELIDHLQTFAPTARVLLHDPDTGWLIPIEIGENKYQPGKKAPPGSVVLTAHYGNEL